jgi:hypothetical protein
MSKTIEKTCVGFNKVYPYGQEEGCYVLIPEFGTPEPNGDYYAEDLQETFEFKEGVRYRITVEELP